MVKIPEVWSTYQKYGHLPEIWSTYQKYGQNTRSMVKIPEVTGTTRPGGTVVSLMAPR